MKMPRLKQPLFSLDHGELYNRACGDPLLSRLIQNYDCIWNLIYPTTLNASEIRTNAEANLNNIGSIIESAIGEDVFEVDSKQLSFPEEILDCNQRPLVLDDSALNQGELK